MYRLFLLSLLALAACATPREQCLRMATRDLPVLDELIAQTAANIERGYALTTETRTTAYWQFCASPSDHFHWCAVPHTSSRKVPVAIDVQAERAKLASLKAKRVELRRKAQRQIAACNAAYPQ